MRRRDSARPYNPAVQPRIPCAPTVRAALSRPRVHRCFAFLLALALPSAAMSAPAPDDSEIQRLSSTFTRLALQAVQTAQRNPELVNTATSLAQVAAELTPDSPDAWRLVIRIGELRDRPKDSIVGDALARVSALDPRDDVVALKRLRNSIDSRSTAETKIEAYRVFLDERNRGKLSAPVASRLSLDLANLIFARDGATPQYAESLAEAVSLDPSNLDAARQAAQFYLDRVNDDAYAAAEAMVTVVLADPTDVEWLTALAHHLSDHGAYRGAARLYNAAISTMIAKEEDPGSLQVDYAVGLWGAGDSDAALEALQNLQRSMNRAAQYEALRANPTSTPLDVKDVTGSLPPDAATARAAILRRKADFDPAQIAATLASFDQAIEKSTKEEEKLRLRLQRLWIMTLLDVDTQAAVATLEELQAAGALTDDAIARYRAWIMLREGDAQGAKDAFSKLSIEEPLVRLGLATAERKCGDLRAAATGFLEVARRSAGSVVGVWAAEELHSLLGRRPDLSTEATRLETLIESLPAFVERAGPHPEDAIALRLTTSEGREFNAFEPVRLTLELTNTSPVRLSIGPSGPLRPQVALRCQWSVMNRTDRTTFPIGVIDLDRRLGLAPGEKMVVPIDLLRTNIGMPLLMAPMSGTTIQVNAITNFIMTSGVPVPWLLGLQAGPVSLRMEGIRTSSDWIESACQNAESTTQQPDPVALAVLCLFTSTSALPDELKPQIEHARRAIPLGYSRLSDESAAWVLSIMPRDCNARDEVLAQARQRQSREVKALYLMYQIDGKEDTDDAVYLAARESDDALLRGLVAWLEAILEQAEDVLESNDDTMHIPSPSRP